MNKVVASVDEAIKDVSDGASIMIGGFGLCGIPENLIRALVRKGVKDLTTISNNAGVDGFGVGLLLSAGRICQQIGGYVGEKKVVGQKVPAGKSGVGTGANGAVSERMRGACGGIPGV